MARDIKDIWEALEDVGADGRQRMHDPTQWQIQLSVAISASRMADALERIADALGAFDKGGATANWWLQQIAGRR